MKRLLAGVALLAVSAGPAPPQAANPIQLNQIGFAPDAPKIAVVASDAPGPLDWTLIDAAGEVRSKGRAIPFGVDPTSHQRVQQIDFSGFARPGTGYRLIVAGTASHPFMIRAHPFHAVATAAMAFFYQQRSGVPIRADVVERPDLARSAGHRHERVTCFSGKDVRGAVWPGCDYTLDVTGGWYDAGDQGKYVVNGGIAVWTLLDLHERLAAWGAPDAFGDGRLALPERGNGADDLLDEARTELSFLLAMQIPDHKKAVVAMRIGGGAPASGFVAIDAGGMAHSKVADVRWTPLPTAPADDTVERALYPPTTAATLNLAAVAAQAARIWRQRDPAFAACALTAARRAWDAAERNPAIYASSDFTGSGGYGDDDVRDERFWAAAELFITTGAPEFAAIVARSPFLTHPSGGLNWGRLDQAGLMSLATVPSALPPATRATVRASLIALADRLLAARARTAYRIPIADAAFSWGSNATLLNRAMLFGVAWQIDAKPAYRAAALDVGDYLLGRNALDRAFITGFGARPMEQPHHRFWAHAADPRYPRPPSGVLSGGPNSTAMTDPVSAPMKGRCIGQTCWVDDWRAFTMNEVAINWNAALVWVTAFLDASEPPAPPRRPPEP